MMRRFCASIKHSISHKIIRNKQIKRQDKAVSIALYLSVQRLDSILDMHINSLNSSIIYLMQQLYTGIWTGDE